MMSTWRRRPLAVDGIARRTAARTARYGRPMPRPSAPVAQNMPPDNRRNPVDHDGQEHRRHDVSGDTARRAVVGCGVVHGSRASAQAMIRARSILADCPARARPSASSEKITMPASRPSASMTLGNAWCLALKTYLYCALG